MHTATPYSNPFTIAALQKDYFSLSQYSCQTKIGLSLFPSLYGFYYLYPHAIKLSAPFTPKKASFLVNKRSRVFHDWVKLLVMTLRLLWRSVSERHYWKSVKYNRSSCYLVRLLALCSTAQLSSWPFLVNRISAIWNRNGVGGRERKKK